MKKYLLIIAIIFLPTVTQASLADGLQIYWPFDRRDMTVTDSVLSTYDRSGNNRHGTSTISLSSLGIGRKGQSLLFNGTSVGTYDISVSSELTVSFWSRMNQEVATALRFLTVAGTPTVAFSVLGFNYTPPTSDIYGIQVGSGFGQSTQPIVSGRWDFLSFSTSDSGKTWDFYFNGVYKETLTTGQTYSAFTRLTAGTSFTESVSANLDDVRIYNRVLSASEVKGLYIFGFSKILSNLI
jgi:hypothetical protein